MKIVHVIPYLRIGGAEKFTVDLCNSLAQNTSNEIFIISLYDNEIETTLRKNIADNVTYIQLGKNAGFEPMIPYKLYKVLKKIKPTIVNTHTGAFEYTVLSAILLRHTKFFHTLHTKANVETALAPIKLVKKFLFKNKIKVITISEDGSQSYKELYGLSNDFIIINGSSKPGTTSQLEILQDSYRDYDKVFVHVARVMKEKNQLLLIQSFLKFNHEKNCVLLVVGDIRDQEIYQALLDLIKEDKRIKFVGGVSNVGDYLSISDYFCLSSIYEGMPISIIEAMSYGVVPISTNVGGISELITDSENGFLVNTLEVEDYTSTLERAYATPNYQNISDKCIEIFNKKYNIMATANNYLNYYKQWL